jgi:hypothetical protein
MATGKNAQEAAAEQQRREKMRDEMRTFDPRQNLPEGDQKQESTSEDDATSALRGAGFGTAGILGEIP